jgi:hypothetical protein
MNIKRIIREEIDDLDWVRDTTPTVGFFIEGKLFSSQVIYI